MPLNCECGALTKKVPYSAVIPSLSEDRGKYFPYSYIVE